MTQRINPYTPPVQPSIAATSASISGNASAGASKPVTPVAATDQVQLTGGAVELQRASQSLGSDAPSEDARVSQLKQAIADGSFTVNSHQVAAKLSRFERDLGSA